LCEYVWWAASPWELRENKHILFLVADVLLYIVKTKEILSLLKVKLVQYNDEFTRSLKCIVKLINGCIYFTEFSVRKVQIKISEIITA
jgi:hypothetical protein